MIKVSLNGLLCAFEIWPSFETVALDKTGFVGVQETPIGRERYKFQMVLKDHSLHRGLISSAVLDAPAAERTARRCAMLAAFAV
jgi:hypothetical protein